MRKKVYKKNERVIFALAKKRKPRSKKLTIPAFILFAVSFFIVLGLYYLSFWYTINSINFVYRTFLVNKIGNTQASVATISITPTVQKLLGKHVAVLKQKKVQGSDQIIWHGSRDTKEVALTFDADMTPVMVDWLHSGQVSTYNDTRITDYLIQHQINATFFLTGLWIESYPDATRVLADNSLFELENHSYSHPSMAGYCFDQPQVSESQYPFEIEKTQQLIEQYTHQMPKYFRFPGGCYNQADLALVKKEGLETVHWDAVGNDGFNDNEEQVIDNVLSEAENGSIIVLHMGGASNVPVTADALPTIVDGLKKKGFTFVTVSQLLNPPKIVTKINPKEYLTSLESFQTVSP